MSNQANVSVFFELHIRPLFHLLDRVHMINRDFGDLWDYDTLMGKPDGRDKIRAEIVLDLLVASDGMPPETHGGPWPSEWIALYRRWMKEGYRRLTPGTATYRAMRVGDDIRLRGQGEAPSPGYQVWLNIEVADRTQPYFEYTLFLKPPSGAVSDEPTDFIVNEKIVDAPADLKTVRILDADGTYDIPIEGAVTLGGHA